MKFLMVIHQDTLETSDSDNALKLFCRLRPLKTKTAGLKFKEEDSEALNDAIQRKDNKVLTLQKENSFLVQQYIFEHIFAKNDSQCVVFEKAAAHLID